MRRLVTVLTGLIVFTAACASDGTTSSDTEAPDDSSVASTPDTEPATTGAATSDSEPTDSEATDPPTSETPATEPEVTEPPPTEAPLSELPEIGLGDYQVGVSTITITDTVRNRPLTVEVWFPLADDVTGEPHRYTFVTGDYYESPQAVSADPSSISPDGPFPLVVYSHGSGGTRYIHSNYT